MYTILDVLDKFIDIEKNSYVAYMKMLDVENLPQSIRTIVLVLAREESRHVKIYEGIKERLKDKNGLEIDFESYDKISKFLSDFNRNIVSIKFENTNDLLQHALDFEKRYLALVIRIQGILVKKLEDEDTIPYEVLSELIKDENKHIEAIEKFIK